MINTLIKQENVKKKIGNILKIICVFLTCLIPYLIFLYVKGSLWDFFNYTVLGLFDFNKNNMQFNQYFFWFILEILLSLIMTYIIVNKKMKIEDSVKNKITVLLAFSIPLLFNAYPIFNKAHIILSSIFMIITIIYFMEKILLKDLLNHEIVIKILKYFNCLAIIIIFVLFVWINSSYIKNIQNNIYDVYYGGVLNNQENIQNVIKYIQEQKQNEIQVKIISYKATLYNNILKINNGKIDLPFYGNLGIEGIEGIIKEINNMKNTNILITKEEIKYQESQELRDYIINNFEKIGEIEEFYIYKVGY